MTTHNDDAVREVTRQQRAERRNATSTPRNDKPTKADLTRELHHMRTQVEQHGFPGTRAVLAELERLRAENARLIAVLRAIQRLKAKWRAPIHSDDVRASNGAWAAVGSEAHKLACDALDNA